MIDQEAVKRKIKELNKLQGRHMTQNEDITVKPSSFSTIQLINDKYE
tara:strand:- start:257 stop:397 length:141 start_codon:yes stop_codon:yes gene_type:complete